MRIAIVAPEILPVPPVRGGAVETVIEEVSARLGEHDVQIFGIADPLLPYVERRGFRTYHRYHPSLVDRLLLSSWKLPFKQRRSPLFCRPYSRWVAERLRVLPPDVVWVHSRIQFVVPIRRTIPGARLILSLHNESHLEFDTVWTPEVIRACDVITSCGASLHQELLRLRPVASDRAVVLHNGVDPSVFVPGSSRPAERQQLRASHGVCDRWVILYVGRLVEAKGVHLLIDAFAQLADECPQASLVIVGSSAFADGRSTPYIDGLKRQAQPLNDRIRFVGYLSREALAPFMRLADVAVFPSVWAEPFGMVVVEAMATGLPVVAFKRGGPAEIIQHGRDGWLVPPDDGARGLAEALRRLLRDPAAQERLGRAARETVETRFTWQATADRFTALCSAYPKTSDVRGSGFRVQGEDVKPRTPSPEPRTTPVFQQPAICRSRILIAESGSGYGGTAKYLLDLVSLLDRRRYDLQVLAEQDGPLLKRIREQGVPVTMRPAWRFPWTASWASRWPRVVRYPIYGLGATAQLLLTVPAIAMWLRHERIDLVHLNNELLSHLPLLLAARWTGCRVVCHLHGWRPFTRSERWAVGAADRLVCISEAGARYHREQLGGRAVLAIPNGLRLNGEAAPERLARTRPQQRAAWGICEDQRVIGIVGRLVPWKGHPVFLRALARVASRHPEVVGVVVGHDPSPEQAYVKRLQNSARELGLGDTIRFIPWQEDIWAMYAAMDVVVHASTDPEPFGLVVLEAMAAGKPVIASNAGGVVDVVLDQETGLLVKPGEAEALADAIERLCADRALADSLGREAQRRARGVFTMERNAAQVSAVYDQLLAPTRSVSRSEAGP